MGDIIGDLNKRRGRVMGMNPDPDGSGWQVVEAEVPMGEMSSYAIDLRSMTQGRGSYAIELCPLRGSPADEPGQDHRGREEGRGVIPA